MARPHRSHRSWESLAVLLAAMAGCGGDEPAAPPRPEPIRVRGMVLDGLDRPAAGVRIAVTGLPEVTSGSDGRFTATGTFAPYDLVAVGDGEILVFRALTRRDPTVRLVAPRDTTAAFVTLQGILPPSAAGRTTLSFVAGDFLRSLAVDSGATTFVWPLHVPAASVPGTLHVLRWNADARGLPSVYLGHSTRPVTLTGGRVVQVDFAPGDFVDPAEGPVSGEALLPAGYTLLTRSLALRVAGRGVPIAVEMQPGSLSFAYVVPVVPEAPAEVWHDAVLETGVGPARSFSVRSVVVQGTGGLVVQVEAAARPLSPADGTAGVDSTTVFQWTGGAADVHAVWFVPAAPGEPTVGVYLTGISTLLPDLAPLGLPWPRGASYSWHVERLVATSSVDEVASADAPPAAGGFTRSEPFSFVTRSAARARREHP